MGSTGPAGGEAAFRAGFSTAVLFAERLPRGRDGGRVRGYTVASAPTALPARQRFVQMTHEESRSNSCSLQEPPRLLTNSLGGSGAHWTLSK